MIGSLIAFHVCCRLGSSQACIGSEDDGPSMTWIYGIGLTSLLSIAIGLPLIYAAHRVYKKST